MGITIVPANYSIVPLRMCTFPPDMSGLENHHCMKQNPNRAKLWHARLPAKPRGIRNHSTWRQERKKSKIIWIFETFTHFPILWEITIQMESNHLANQGRPWVPRNSRSDSKWRVIIQMGYNHLQNKLASMGNNHIFFLHFWGKKKIGARTQNRHQKPFTFW